MTIDANVAARHVFFTGPRASGKTSVGRLLAQRLSRGFVDTDDLVKEQAGQSIAELVDQEGWPAFRALESKVLAEVCAKEPMVVATGGGMVLAEANRKLMRESGLVFLLWTRAEVLLERLALEQLAAQRPALTNLSWEEEMLQTLAEREPLYRDVAHVMLDSALDMETLVDQAHARLVSLVADTKNG